MAADIPQEITENRLERLLNAVKEKSRIILTSRIAKIEEVMFETPDFGRSSSNMAVRSDVEVSPGSIMRVKIMSTGKNTLFGKVLL